MEVKIRTPGFCFHVGPWAVVEGGVLNLEGELHLLSSPSSHSYQLVGLGRVPSCGTDGSLFMRSHSLLSLSTHLGCIPQAPCSCFGHVAEFRFMGYGCTERRPI